MRRLHLKFHDDPKSKEQHRKLTRDEISDVRVKEKELRALEKQIKVLTKKLNGKIASYEKDPFYRNVFSDSVGTPYDLRTFVLTGETNLI